MANYANIKATIDANIKANGNEEITGPILNSVLNAMVNTLGAGYQYASVATPDTNPGTPDSNVFYLASDAGTYTNFGGLVVTEGEVAILKYNGTWTKEVTGAATAAQLNQLGQEVDVLNRESPRIGDTGGNVDYSNVDYSIEDPAGNAIAIFRRGHIKTKNFDSEINAFTEENAEKLDSIEENAQVNDTITGDTFPTDFAITDEEGKAIFGVVDGYPFSKNFDGKKVAKTSELVSDMKPYKTTIVSIADYDNNLMDVFAAISPTEENHYVILIPEGTYNVDEWFTPAQIASDSSDFRGVELLNYTKLLGVGCADKIILQWINETYPHRSYISTLNTHEWNELENLTIKAKNIRYAVHDDIWNGLDRHIRVKNCSFIVNGSTTRAWGAGCNGGYDGVFENCKFIMEESTPAPTDRYVEPFVLHDNYYNTRRDSHLTLLNCRFVTPYTSYHQPLDHNSWEEIAYDSSYPLYDSSKKDYAVNDCCNMPDDTSASYRCLYANTQVMPYGEGRPSLNIGFGSEGATQPLYVTMIGCYLSTYMAVTPTLVRVSGFGNKSGKTPTAILWDESDDAYSTIIDLI